MEVTTALIAEAKNLALIAEKRASALQAELEEIESKKAAIDAKCSLARGAAKRLLDYKPTSGGKFLCPRCWIDRGVESTLRAVPGDDKVDVLRCACGTDWEIPLD